MTIKEQREQAKTIIDQLSDARIEIILPLLINLQEVEDDLYCFELAKQYLDDPDPDKNKGINLNDLAKELGVEL